MPTLGKIEYVINLVNPSSRLRLGLDLLNDCVTGRFPEILNRLPSLSPGETVRFPVDGDALYILIQCVRPRTRKSGRFEAHERYADLQFVWSGCERIEVLDLPAAQREDYDSNGNVYFTWNESTTRLLLHAGEVAVLMPGEAHAPCLQAQGGGEDVIRKIVVKIRDAHSLGPDETGKYMVTSNSQGLTKVAPSFVTAASNPNCAPAR